jgi:cytoskeletal protein RodZ
VDQVSRPLLIVLVAVVFLAVGWMGFLRPSAVESTTEEVTAPVQVATQAAKAAAATEEKAKATEAAADAASGEQPATQAPATATETPQAKAAAPAKKDAEPAKPADAEAKVIAEMEAGKVVVLLFWDRTGADDRAARDAARAVDRRDGKVAVHLVDVKDVGRYESVTQGVTVAQSPTTMIIAPDGKARTIAGLTEPTEVDQLVRAALPGR